ncbi:hypothetical protein SKAU_G00304600 [Synaphobranchus kaupii]|uniref:Uncharacterized protein n=1 Tax=Synaphobranchus kaupii TaxID=118154 RepID=A0A9Q1EW99_SYNKA|nr:hypothetical protein SKAU_G00304600 [Synaphobranchus kaupii]
MFWADLIVRLDITVQPHGLFWLVLDCNFDVNSVKCSPKRMRYKVSITCHCLALFETDNHKLIPCCLLLQTIGWMSVPP